jgi:hypothetical protein
MVANALASPAALVALVVFGTAGAGALESTRDRGAEIANPAATPFEQTQPRRAAATRPPVEQAQPRRAAANAPEPLVPQRLIVKLGAGSGAARALMAAREDPHRNLRGRLLASSA